MLRPGTILQQKNICFFIFPFCLTDFYSIVNPFGIFVYLFREELYSMKQRCDRPRPTVGARNIKTALSASLCALLYFLIDRNPTFACIGAIFGMGANMEHSKLHGGNRLFGTVIGGFLGMGLFRLYLLIYPDGGHRLLLVPLLFLGVIVLIVLAQCFWIGAVQPGGVVLCIVLFNTPVDSYVSYALNRMADTAIGVAMSLLINYLLPRERLERWSERVRARLGRGSED